MKRSKPRTLKSVNFKSANGVALIARHQRERDFRDQMRNIWRIDKTSGPSKDRYVDSINDSIGKMYSIVFKEVKSFEDYVDIWRGRWVLDGGSIVGLSLATQ